MQGIGRGIKCAIAVLMVSLAVPDLLFDRGRDRGAAKSAGDAGGDTMNQRRQIQGGLCALTVHTYAFGESGIGLSDNDQWYASAARALFGRPARGRPSISVIGTTNRVLSS